MRNHSGVSLGTTCGQLLDLRLLLHVRAMIVSVDKNCCVRPSPGVSFSMRMRTPALSTSPTSRHSLALHLNYRASWNPSMVMVNKLLLIMIGGISEEGLGRSWLGRR